jgi:hypothetical protein
MTLDGSIKRTNSIISLFGLFVGVFLSGVWYSVRLHFGLGGQLFGVIGKRAALPDQGTRKT